MNPLFLILDRLFQRNFSKFVTSEKEYLKILKSVPFVRNRSTINKRRYD